MDGDTLLLSVDLGFEVIKRQRLRLASIDTPPAATSAGRAAKRYVVERLAVASLVVIKTQRQDLHGRYVGHVFYATSKLAADAVFARGRYLNQELLDEGLAVKL